jgi:hypothetical protein
MAGVGTMLPLAALPLAERGAKAVESKLWGNIAAKNFGILEGISTGANDTTQNWGIPLIAAIQRTPGLPDAERDAQLFFGERADTLFYQERAPLHKVYLAGLEKGKQMAPKATLKDQARAAGNVADALNVLEKRYIQRIVNAVKKNWGKILLGTTALGGLVGGAKAIHHLNTQVGMTPEERIQALNQADIQTALSAGNIPTSAILTPLIMAASISG